MADSKLSDLPAVIDVQGTDELVLARTGTSNKITAANLLGPLFDVVGAGSGATVIATDTDIGTSPLSIAVPGSIQDGDLVVLAAATVNSTPNASGPTTSGGGAAWTERLRIDTSSSEYQTVYTKVAASESGNWQLTHSSGSEACMAVAVYRGVDTLWSVAFGSDTYLSPTVLGHPEGLQILVYFTAGAGSSNLTAPIQVTEDEFIESATANKCQAMICHRETYIESGAGVFEASSTGVVTFAGSLAMVFHG